MKTFKMGKRITILEAIDMLCNHSTEKLLDIIEKCESAI